MNGYVYFCLRLPGQRKEVYASTQYDAVQKALPEFGFTVLSAKLGYQAKTPVSGLSDEQMAEVEAFLEALDNHDDVQDMFVGLAG